MTADMGAIKQEHVAADRIAKQQRTNDKSRVRKAPSIGVEARAAKAPAVAAPPAVASMDVDSGASAAAAADAPAPQIDAAKAAPALSGYYEHAPALGVKNRRARAPAARYGVG